MPERGGFGFGGGFGGGPSRGMSTQYQTTNQQQANGTIPSQEHTASQNSNTNQHIVNPVQNLRNIGGYGVGHGQIGRGDNLITYGVKRIIRHVCVFSPV